MPSSSVPLPQTQTATHNPPSNTRPLPTGPPAYLPGLQLLREKWGQGQAGVREQQAHGNGSGENQSSLPPTHTGHTSGGRRLCLCMHKAGAWAVHPGCWELEKPRAEATSRAWRGLAGGGAAEGFQRCSSNYSIHDCKALSNRLLVSEQVAAGREVFQ